MPFDNLTVIFLLILALMTSLHSSTGIRLLL